MRGWPIAASSGKGVEREGPLNSPRTRQLGFSPAITAEVFAPSGARTPVLIIVAVFLGTVCDSGSTVMTKPPKLKSTTAKGGKALLSCCAASGLSPALRGPLAGSPGRVVLRLARTPAGLVPSGFLSGCTGSCQAPAESVSKQQTSIVKTTMDFPRKVETPGAD